MAPLDDVDLRLLTLLQVDGRRTHAALGKDVGLTGPSVYARIKRLEREGVIRGYTAILAPEALDQSLVAFLRVGTAASPGEQEPFETFVAARSEILECHDVDGEDSYVLKVRLSSPRTLRLLLADIRAIPGITRTVTSIALETVKEVRGGAHLADPRRPAEGGDG
ncbi:MAG: Lrp/AsnC family transcriptional regulator [Kutzneria sp.]|nr:Lrp/AsnC family transcriptional regulator [Kutzneria sp.]MBV9846736.1 Lrp/AsnC family transcriptional regulator [Kutzneria sp.]